MSSTTYDHFASPGKLYAIRKHFVDVNKMVSNVQKMHIATAGKRNAGQLPQPFWLGAACGGGSCSAAQGPARI